MQPEESLQQPEHLFTEEDSFRFEYASTGQRFLNFLIDNLLMNYGLSYVTGSLVGYAIGTFFPEFAIELFGNSGQMQLLFFGVVLAYFNYIIYYTFCENFSRVTHLEN